jgi:hypothetical protein
MPYVRRKPDGTLDSLHRDDPGGCAFLPDTDPEVQAFVGNAESAAGFVRLDADFVRVIEDVIDTLIIKNVINLTELPEQAQVKLLARKSFRERSLNRSLRLFESSDFGDVI